MSLFGWSRRSTVRDRAEKLYTEIVLRARDPLFYEHFAVADTVDGRFDMVVLHAFLVLRRLKADPEATDLAQAVFDRMFVDMDENLREMGVGDLSVGRRVKKMAKAFYGRVAAYETGLAGEDSGLADAVHRNLYRGRAVPPHALDAMVSYIRRQEAALAAVENTATLLDKGTLFAPVSGGGSEREE